MESTLSPTPSSSSSSSSSTSTPSISENTTTAYHGIHPNAYIITLSVLGGIALLCLLALTAFWCTRQRRRHHQRHLLHESFWHNWYSKAYSRVDAQTASSLNDKECSPEMSQRGYDYDDDSETAGVDKKGSSAGIMDWWYGRRKSALKMVEEGFEIDSSSSLAKKKQKSGTVHKVKRLKANETFEIDSDVRLSIVDLSLTPSRSR